MKSIVTLSNILLFLITEIYAQTADEIITKAERKMRSGTIYAEMSITSVRPKWSKNMEIKFWAKGNDLSMVLITAPEKEKGTAFLKNKKETWNWMPSINRTIKLPSSMMGQSWMGTDFTNDDVAQESSIEKDYTHTVVKDTVINNLACWKIKLVPKENAVVVWGKIFTYIDKKDFIQLQTKMYDEDEYLVNTIISYAIKEMGGKVIATKMEIIPAEKRGKKTILEYKKIQFNTEIENDFFTIKNMKTLE